MAKAPSHALGALRRTTLLPLILGATWLSPTIARAQQAVPLAGRYTACFRAADSTRPACGTVTLAPTMFCGAAHDGYYSVLFSALHRSDSTASLPPDERRFTWTAHSRGEVQLTAGMAVRDSLPGHMRCSISNDSAFEASGQAMGDSIAGTWGILIDWEGARRTLGTFVLYRVRQ